MKLVIVGTGYVGLVTGACFADMGNAVSCIDIDEAKLESLRNGVIPIHEPGLSDLVVRNFNAGRLKFSSDLAIELENAELVFIAVGTPSNEDGSADLTYVLNVAAEIGASMTHSLVIIDKSTVPVGTADKVAETIAGQLAIRGLDLLFDVASNPEFLKEGAAVNDFMQPDRIIVGTHSDHTRLLMKELYAPFSRNHDKLHFMSVRDAEMTKYAANAMLATKISFMNEIALMCEHFGVDVENVRKGIGSDPRIGYSFIYPGAGYGGSCFPKDVRALIRMAKEADLEPHMFQAVETRNNAQKSVLFEKLFQHYGGSITGKHIAVWGLAFKPNTDDVREASALELIRLLILNGAIVHAYDPEANETAQRALGQELASQIDFCHSANEALQNCDALAILTEWKVFRQPDFDLLKVKIRDKVIFDGRNMYEPTIVSRAGLIYRGIGRTS